MFGIIYKATCVENGKPYVGQTIGSLPTRIRRHFAESKRNTQYPFHRALRKYGEDAWLWEQIDTAETAEELNEKEKYWITTLRSMSTENGYNCVEGGQHGHHLTQEVRDKISAAHKGKKHTEETKQLLSQKLSGLVRSDEAKQHYLASWTFQRREERKEKYEGKKNPNFGNHMPEESRLNISKKAKARGGRPQTEAERKKRSDSIRAWHAKRKQLLLEQSTN